MIILKALWLKLWPYLALIAAAFAAFFGIRQSGKAQGRREVEQEQERAASENRRKTNEADSKLAQMDDDDVRRRLSEFVRDNDN